MWASAVAASARPAAATLARIRNQLSQRRLGRGDVVGPPRVGQRDRGGDDDARLAIGQVATHEDRGVFVFELGERPQRRGAHVHVFVLHHARDGRHPSAGGG